MTGPRSSASQSSESRVPSNGDMVVHQESNLQVVVLQRGGSSQGVSSVTCPVRQLQLEDAGHALRVVADEYSWSCSDQYTQALLCGGELRQVADCFQTEYYRHSTTKKGTEMRTKRRGQW